LGLLGVFFPGMSDVRLDAMTQQAAVRIRSFATGDWDAVMALAPRLTEGVASWREPADVLRAVKGWVSGSIGAAGRDDHAFYVATADDCRGTGCGNAECGGGCDERGGCGARGGRCGS
jgi:hypothetical protein